jgi:hypothetical protein
VKKNKYCIKLLNKIKENKNEIEKVIALEVKRK